MDSQTVLNMATFICIYICVYIYTYILINTLILRKKLHWGNVLWNHLWLGEFHCHLGSSFTVVLNVVPCKLLGYLSFITALSPDWRSQIWHRMYCYELLSAESNSEREVALQETPRPLQIIMKTCHVMWPFPYNWPLVGGIHRSPIYGMLWRVLPLHIIPN